MLAGLHTPLPVAGSYKPIRPNTDTAATLIAGIASATDWSVEATKMRQGITVSAATHFVPGVAATAGEPAPKVSATASTAVTAAMAGTAGEIEHAATNCEKRVACTSVAGTQGISGTPATAATAATPCTPLSGTAATAG